MVCDSEDSVIRGDITISTGCVIHPSAVIIAKSGPIVLGENCLVEEYATIIHDTGDETTTTERPPVLNIGPNNVFEVGCHVEALQIGERNVFEVKCYVSNKVKVSNSCIVGAGCRLEGVHNLSEHTIIHGNGAAQRETIEKQTVCWMKVVFTIKKVIIFF